jgi:HEAT repeat
MKVNFISWYRGKKEVRAKFEILAVVFLLSSGLTMAQQKTPSQSAQQAKTRPSFVVEWTQGLLTLNAEKTSLACILSEIATQTGVAFSGLEQVHRRISVHFSKVPLAEALPLLLARLDYATIGDARDPSAMRIIVSRDREPEVIAVEELPEPNPRSQAGEEEAQAKVPHKTEKQKAVIQPDQTAESSQDLSNLLQALGDKDPSVKEAAIQALAQAEGPQSMEVLWQAFPDLDSALKIIVIENTGGRPDAVPLLLEASRDSQKSVREAALGWLDSQANQ